VKIYPFFITHSGCPHRCLFCAQDRSVNSTSVPTADDVAGRLEELLPQKGDGEIAFYGGTFSALPTGMQEQYLDAARRFVFAGQVSGVRISTRPDALDDACIDRLKSAGVTTIEIGCQSFDDKVLLASGRGHTSADACSAVRRCLDAGVMVGVQLMPGLPGSTPDESLLSLRTALNLRPTFLRIYPTVVIEGTELADMWRRGEFQPWSLDETVDLCADMLYECRLAGVPVIRLGLQHDSQLESNLLAGPYHPAFGQLVRSRLWRRAVANVAADESQCAVNPVDLSDVIGHCCENRQWFNEHYPDLTVNSNPEVSPGFLRVMGGDRALTSLLARGEMHDQ